jgi:Rrf2 family protein
MKLSTRARYGVRLMLVLATNYPKGPIFLKSIAAEEELSEKYLSRIVILLRAADLVNSVRGAHGGYNLSRDPSQITLKEIIDALEGNITLVDCVKNPATCLRSPRCVTRDIWEIISGNIAETLHAITLADLVEKVVLKKTIRKGGNKDLQKGKHPTKD